MSVCLVDILLVMLNFFRGVTTEAQRANIDWKSAFLKGVCQFWAKISRRRGRPPPSTVLHVWKTRVIDLCCGIRMRQKISSGVTRGGGDRGDTRMKKNCGWIYKEQWTNEVGQVEKGPGWHPIEWNQKSDSDERKKSSSVFFRKNRGDTTTDRRWWLKKVVRFFRKK